MAATVDWNLFSLLQKGEEKRLDLHEAFWESIFDAPDPCSLNVPSPICIAGTMWAQYSRSTALGGMPVCSSAQPYCTSFSGYDFLHFQFRAKCCWSRDYGNLLSSYEFQAISVSIVAITCSRDAFSTCSIQIRDSAYGNCVSFSYASTLHTLPCFLL